MEGGIEAGNCEVGPQRSNGPRRQAERLVQAQGRQSGHRFNRLVGDFSWAVEIASAMNYAMSYARRCSG